MAAPKDSEPTASESSNVTRTLTKVVEAMRELQQGQNHLEQQLEHLPTVIVGMMDLPGTTREIHEAHAEQLEPLRQTVASTHATVHAFIPRSRWRSRLAIAGLGAGLLVLGYLGGSLSLERGKAHMFLMNDLDTLLLRKRAALPPELRQEIDTAYDRHGFVPLSKR